MIGPGPAIETSLVPGNTVGGSEHAQGGARHQHDVQQARRVHDKPSRGDADDAEQSEHDGVKDPPGLLEQHEVPDAADATPGGEGFVNILLHHTDALIARTFFFVLMQTGDS